MEEKIDKAKLRNSNKIRTIIVLLFIILFVICTYIALRGSYLEYKELGENYTQVFFTNLKYKLSITAINFIFIYTLMYFTNRGIKKVLKEFFDKEKKQMPKLLNKSIAFIVSVLVSTIFSSIMMEKIILISSNVSFVKTDPIFNLDIAYYLFQKPVIEMILTYLIGVVIVLSIYMVVYYLVVFHMYFDGIDRNQLKESKFIKKIIRNIIIITIGISIINILKTSDILTNQMLTIKTNSETSQNLEIIGAGYTEVLIQRWGYAIFSLVMIIAVTRAVKGFNKKDTSKVLKNLLILPIYLIGLFLVMVLFNAIFVNSNKFDKEKEYLAYNIEFTKNAYNIDIEEKTLENPKTITQEEINQNKNIVNNIRIINEETVVQSLQDNQTSTGYYSYRNANIAKYKISGNDKLVYISQREISNLGRTYDNKTYEYTHGMGLILASASEVTEDGKISYVQKETSGEDDKIDIDESRLYFGLETNHIVATNTKNKKEYDYTDENGNEHTSTYEGNAGLNLSFLDRVILGLTKGDLKLAFSGEMTKESKILLNRNIINRAKKALPYLIYDENPYTVVTEKGNIVWVIDAYTTSSNYPYSQYTVIQHDGIKEKINYIRNSIKVIIDSYDGTIKFYITDQTDPIAMAYRNVYSNLFEPLDEKIPDDISEHFIYPQYLYNVQAELLKTYHNVKTDVLFRVGDIWDFAKYNNTIISKSSGTVLKPYYALINDEGLSKIGLIQTYTPESKQNLKAYLVGTTNESSNKLKLYKFLDDSNILGPMQLDNQIEQDETIYNEIKTLNTTGTKITKDMVVIPINNTLLYVETVYQTMLNVSKVPTLKKVVVASGNKVAIGNDFQEALSNLLSKEATDIEIENTDDIKGLIDAIIKANLNLNESINNNDWELMGADIKKLQQLIDSLEEMRKKEINDEKKTNTDINNNINDDSSNTINEENNKNTSSGSFISGILKK